MDFTYIMQKKSKLKVSAQCHLYEIQEQPKLISGDGS